MPTPWLKFFFWVYLLFLLGAAATAVNPADPDLWHRLAVGEYLAHTGHFPKGDTFSYLADYQDIADHEWGSAVIFYALWSVGGGAAIVLTKVVTLAATLALVVWAGNAGRRPTLAVTGFYAVVLLALLPSFQSTVRCMVFTHLLFRVLGLSLATRAARAARRDVALSADHDRVGEPPRRIRHRLVLAGAADGDRGRLSWPLESVGRATSGWCVLATLVNPYGWNLWTATGRALLATRQGFRNGPRSRGSRQPAIYPGYKVLLSAR